MRRVLREWTLIAAAIIAGVASVSAQSQTLTGDELVKALRAGGHVLLMRHAKSPRTPPEQQMANPDNTNLERQLDDTGRATARGMGNALRALRIPLDEVLSSPTYRALETVRQAGLENPRSVSELGDGGHSMQQEAADARASWLREKLTALPKAGMNTLLVTHQPNIASALGSDGPNLQDGEMLVVLPEKVPKIIARVRIEEWPALAAR